MVAPTRDAGGGRRITAVESGERKSDARASAGQKKLEPHPATRRSKAPRPTGTKAADGERGGRNARCNEEMKFPVPISARQRIAVVVG